MMWTPNRWYVPLPFRGFYILFFTLQRLFTSLTRDPVAGVLWILISWLKWMNGNHASLQMGKSPLELLHSLLLCNAHIYEDCRYYDIFWVSYAVFPQEPELIDPKHKTLVYLTVLYWNAVLLLVINTCLLELQWSGFSTGEQRAGKETWLTLGEMMMGVWPGERPRETGPWWLFWGSENQGQAVTLRCVLWRN